MGNRKIGRHSRHNAVDLRLLLRNYLLPDSRKMRVRWQALWKNLLPCEASKHYVTSVPTYVGKNSKPKGVGERGTPLPKTAKRPARHHCAWTMRLAIVCFRFFFRRDHRSEIHISPRIPPGRKSGSLSRVLCDKIGEKKRRTNDSRFQTMECLLDLKPPAPC